MASPTYRVYRCPQCWEQVEEPGHTSYASPGIAGHYHEEPAANDDPNGSYDRWYEAELIWVPAPTATEGGDDASR